MLGFSPLTAGPLAALPVAEASGTESAYETAPLGGVVLGTDGSTFVEGSASGAITAEASATIAVTGTGIANRIVNSGTTSGTLAVTGTGVARGIFHASTDATSTTVFTVTVASGTNVYGSGNKFYINGSIATPLTLYEGNTYRFDQSASSNSGHPLRFSATANGTSGGGSEYTTGVTTSGTAGSSGAYTEITVPDGGPPLHFYCAYHGNMGNSADTPTTITAAITGTVAAGRIAASDTASGTFAVTGTAVATSIEVVLLANVDITATGAAEAIRVRGLDSTTGNDIAITDDVRASAVFGMVGSGDVASTGTGTASRVLGMAGSGTAAFSGTALVLPDPTNYATKDVLTSTTSAGTTFTGTASPPIRYQYAIGTGGVALTGTGTPTGVFSAQAEGTAAITGTALHNAGQKYVLGSGAVSVVGSTPQILISVSAVPATTTVTTSGTSAGIVRLRQLDGTADAPVVTGTCGEALRFRLVDGAGDVASTGTGITSAILSAQGTGDTAATSTATAIKIRIMSPSSGSIAVTEAASAIRFRGVIGSATGAATATADGIVLTLKLMQAASDVAVTEVADVQRILPRIGAAAIAADGTIDVKAIFSPIVDGRITCGSFAQIFRSQTSERTDAIVQRYSRRVLPTGELRDTLGNEFQNIERTLSSVTEATILLTDVEPETKRRGMVRYAVTPWIPVAGHSGLVVYDGNTWSAV
jgi:hypothetical protein